MAFRRCTWDDEYIGSVGNQTRCGRAFDDVTRATICPHRLLAGGDHHGLEPAQGYPQGREAMEDEAEADTIAVVTAVEAAQVLVVMPEALGTEDGDTWWIHGHVEPAVAVLAVWLSESCNADVNSAAECLTGQVAGPDATYPSVPSWTDAAEYLAEMVNMVERSWWVQNPENDERMDRVDEGTEGAQPFTIVRTP